MLTSALSILKKKKTDLPSKSTNFQYLLRTNGFGEQIQVFSLSFRNRYFRQPLFRAISHDRIEDIIFRNEKMVMV